MPDYGEPSAKQWSDPLRAADHSVPPGPGLNSRYGVQRNNLSERELEIIELVATGLTNQEIAIRLTISKRTVDNHVSNIFTKTGAKNRVALINWAMDNGKICRDGFNCCAIDTNSPPR